MRVHSRRVAIAGGGIAGLTAALCLARIGFHAVVHEQAATPGEVGAGLQLSPNATRILAELGVLNRLLPVAVRPSSIDLASLATGRTLLSLPLTRDWQAEAGAPWLVAHRADLHAALLEAARSTPDVEVHFGSTVDDFAMYPKGVTVSSRTASSFDETECLALIGADGVWSALRGRIPNAKQASFSGMVAWRAMIPAPLPGGQRHRVVAWLAPKAHLVGYPVRNGAWSNIVAITRGAASLQNWAVADAPDRFLNLMGRTASDMSAFLGQSEAWTRWPLYAVDPDGPWVDRRLVLIGDAAHAMTPFAAQGAGMAIEDAWALAVALQENRAEPERAFAAYARERRPRVRKVARRAGFNRFVYHLPAPMAAARDMAFRMRPAADFLADLDWLYMHRMPDLIRHDPATLAWSGR